MDHSVDTHIARSQRPARLGIQNPVWSAAAVGALGLVVMAGIFLAAAYLVTHLLAQGPVGAWDNSVNRWLVTQRTPTLNTLTAIGSTIGGAPAVVGVALLAAIGLGIGKRWRAVGFLATGLVIEFAVFIVTATVIYRPRPTVPHLEVAPPTSSFPSGHTAAALVLYVGLALIIATLTRSVILRALAWIFAVAIPVFVGYSRMYRGMHHPTDVIGGVVLGVGALIVAHTAVGSPREDRR